MSSAGVREGDVERRLIELCRKSGVLCWKFTSPGTSGVPDRVLVCGGHVVFLELKKPGEKPRKLQEKRLAQLRAAGADARVADSMEAVAAIVSELSGKEA